MAKITINGESFDWDGNKQPLKEALYVEEHLGMRFADYQTDLMEGSMRALCAFVWQVWHRDGRDIELEAILDGDHEFDVIEVLQGLADAADEAEKAAAAKENPAPDPTRRTAGHRTARAGTRSTPTSTRRS